MDRSRSEIGEESGERVGVYWNRRRSNGVPKDLVRSEDRRRDGGRTIRVLDGVRTNEAEEIRVWSATPSQEEGGHFCATNLQTHEI